MNEWKMIVKVNEIKMNPYKNVWNKKEFLENWTKNAWKNEWMNEKMLENRLKRNPSKNEWI